MKEFQTWNLLIWNALLIYRFEEASGGTFLKGSFPSYSFGELVF
jgi:hypothetical protein